MALDQSDITNITNAVSASMGTKFNSVYNKMDAIKDAVERKIDEVKDARAECKLDHATKMTKMEGQIGTLEEKQSKSSNKTWELVKLMLAAIAGALSGGYFGGGKG